MTNLRPQLETLLRRPVSEREWDYLDRLGYLEDVEIDAAPIEYLKEKLDELVEIVESGRQAAGRPPDVARDVRLIGTATSRYDLSRSIVLAGFARKDGDVKNFRREVLGDALIPWEEVPKWLDARRGESPQLVEVTVTSDAPPDGIDEWLPSKPLRVRSVGAEMLLYSRKGENGSWRDAVPVHFGPLQRLHRLARDLATFYGWREEDAVVFVLSDVVPWVAPIWVTTTTDPIYFGQPCEWTRRIKLDLDPSVPPAEVATIYQEARKQAGWSGRRRLSNKHAELAAFRSTMPNESWSNVMAEWNRTHPDEQYMSDQASNFRRDALRAEARLLYPDRFHNETPLNAHASVDLSPEEMAAAFGGAANQRSRGDPNRADA